MDDMTYKLHYAGQTFAVNYQIWDDLTDWDGFTPRLFTMYLDDGRRVTIALAPGVTFVLETITEE